METGEVKVFCINAFMRPPMIQCGGPFGQGDYKSFRLPYLLKKIKAYDLVMLQEMFGLCSRQRTIIAKAREMGFLYHSGPIQPRLKSRHLVDGGLLILSKFPILEHDSRIFKTFSGADGMCSKGVLYARVQISPKMAGGLHVFTTHTQAGENFNEERIRMSQLKELTDFVKEKVLVDPSLPVLLGGDFNLDARHNYIHEHGKSMPRLVPCIESDFYKQVTTWLSLACGHRSVINLIHASSRLKSHLATNGRGHGNLHYALDEPHFSDEKCIDYLFLVLPDKVYQEFKWSFLQSSTGVDECRLVSDGNSVENKKKKDFPVTNLSDHHALFTTLTYTTSPIQAWTHLRQEHGTFLALLQHCFPPPTLNRKPMVDIFKVSLALSIIAVILGMLLQLLYFALVYALEVIYVNVAS